MRLLLLFLFGYFAFRYGKYLFNQFQPVKAKATSTQQAKNTQQQTTTTTTNNSSAKKNNNEEEGEYVDFEEIK